MSFWPGMQITLEHIFKSTTGIAFMWDDEPRKIIAKPFGLLSLGQSVTVGRDQSRYSFADNKTNIYLGGYREITIGIQIFARSARGDNSARSLIEKARLSLINPVIRDELRSAGLVFVESHPITNIDFSFQNRHENRASFDVVFRTVLKQVQPANMGYFDTVVLGNNL